MFIKSSINQGPPPSTIHKEMTNENVGLESSFFSLFLGRS